ncbi:MAG: hypothetical protein WCT40_01565, partial [Candidatus Magasanikbacteria bacterium]
MKNFIDKKYISILERELYKATTDFELAEYFFEKYHVEILKRYQIILRDFSNHYAYLALLSLGKIFDTTRGTNNISYVIGQLTDIAKQGCYKKQVEETKGKMDFIINGRNERIAHSSITEDSEPSIVYATYAETDVPIIRDILKEIKDIIYQLKVDYGYEADTD